MTFGLLAYGRYALRDFDDAVDDRRRHRQNGRLDRRVAVLAAKEDGQVQVEAGQERERMAGVDSHGRNDGIDFTAEELVEPHVLVFVEVVDADKMNAVILQFLLNTI